jgi:hypothetical protein
LVSLSPTASLGVEAVLLEINNPAAMVKFYSGRNSLSYLAASRRIAAPSRLLPNVTGQKQGHHRGNPLP